MDIYGVLQQYFHTDRDKITVDKCISGDVNTSYIASFRGHKVYVKFQDKRKLPALYSGQIERDVAGLSICKEIGVPCPAIVHYDYDKKYIITEYLEYPLLSHIWPELDDAEKEKMKLQAFEILHEINGVKSLHFGQIYGDSSEKSYDNWPDFYRYLVETACADCLSYGTLTPQEADIIVRATKENAARMCGDEAAHFNHLDFHWNNVFVKKENNKYEISGVIDFGSSLYVPSYMDLYRLDGGFLYGTEKFYTKGKDVLTIDKQQSFCADLFNTIDYFVFLSFVDKQSANVKTRLIDICRDYLSHAD